MEVEIIAAEPLSCDSDEEILRKLSEILVKRGNADEKLPEAVVEREKEFPTGLELKGGVNVAIPHADAKYVRRPAIVAAKLEKPVKFRHMVDKKELEVEVVFLLALNDPRKQVQTLQKLATVFENEEMIKKLKTAENSEELAELLKKILKPS
ncbi:MAG: PTS sugar transporter subunit IIA [Thaumarchaeota archaeon]|nr:PTS sugar transporter subunit IIA [Nitrososphaerota archaeon]